MTSVRSLVAIALVTAACSRESRERPAPAPTAGSGPTAGTGQRAVAAVAGYKRSLLAALTAAKRDGIPAAIEVCSRAAPALARKASVDGVTVGRATRRARNPANLVSGWQAEALAQFEAGAAAGRPFEQDRYLRIDDDGRIRYAEPLVIGPPCLSCHGANLEPEVSAALAARYPGDVATGYALGDLRGVAWAELAPSK